MQSFLGKVNFVRRFISDAIEIVKPLQDMIKKDSNFKWKTERREAFDKIKEAIAKAPTLRSPNFDNEFISCTFASDHWIAVVLTQKNEEGEKFTVSFMSTDLQDVELKYPAINKQAFAVFKVVKHFLQYLLRSHAKIIVPHSVIKSLRVQKEPSDQRGNWLTTLQEYDLEINPAKLVKDQGLCKIVAEALDPQNEEDEGWDNEVDMLQREVLCMPESTDSWYNDIKYYLTHGSSPSYLEIGCGVLSHNLCK